MRRPLTVPPVVEKKSDERNVFELANQLHAKISQFNVERVRTTTPGDNVYKTIWTDTLDAGSCFLDILIIGRGTTGGCWYVEQAGLQNFAGVLTVIGATGSTITRKDAALMDEKLIFSGTTVSLQVRDDGVQPMTWTAVVSVLIAG